MKWLLWLLGGAAAGGLVAALRPRQTRAVLDTLERTGVDRVIMNIAAGGAPAGIARTVIRQL